MATYHLRGKTITISEADVKFLEENEFCEFSEEELIHIILPMVTTGDFERGFFTPDIDDVIVENSDEQLSELVKKGIACRRSVIED